MAILEFIFRLIGLRSRDKSVPTRKVDKDIAVVISKPRNIFSLSSSKDVNKLHEKSDDTMNKAEVKLIGFSTLNGGLTTNSDKGSQLKINRIHSNPRSEQSRAMQAKQRHMMMKLRVL